MGRKNELILVCKFIAIGSLVIISPTVINSIYAEKPKFDLTSSTGVYCNKLWDQIELHRKNADKQQADEKAAQYAEVCAPFYGGSPRLATEIDLTRGPLKLAEPSTISESGDKIESGVNSTAYELDATQGRVLTGNILANNNEREIIISIRNYSNTSQLDTTDTLKNLERSELGQNLNENNKRLDKNTILIDRLKEYNQKNLTLDLSKLGNKAQPVKIITNSLLVKLKIPEINSLSLQGSKADLLDKSFSDLAAEVKSKGAIPAGKIKNLGIMHVIVKGPKTLPSILEINKDTLADLGSESKNAIQYNLMNINNIKKSLEANPAVEAVYFDSLMYLNNQKLPTGINRVDGDISSAKSGDGKESTKADIAILDTGVQFDHPDLNVGTCISFVGNYIDYNSEILIDGPPLENCTDKSGHGTHVAGIAAAKDNDIGVVGIAPGAKIHAIKVCGDGGTCSTSDILEGLNYVISHYNEIDVVNLSLGAKVYSWVPDYFVGHGPVEEAITTSVNNYGIVVVAAAGNNNENAGSFSPARVRSAITVSSMTDINGGCYRDPNYLEDDTFSTFSNYGSVVDLAAPGDHIFSTIPGNNYGFKWGTSMAAPHVAGAAALYISAHPAASPSEVIEYLKSTGTNAPARIQEGTALTCNLHGRGYFSGSSDKDDIREPLLYLGPPVCPPDCKISDGSGSSGPVNPDLIDYDGDGIVRKYDNCNLVSNSDQKDTDGDGRGDACESDSDKDGIEDYNANNKGDNCPTTSNRDQKDTDRDGKGDACDSDDDNDGIVDTNDNCRLLQNPNQSDFDEDGRGDRCDLDADGDGTIDRKQREGPLGSDDPIM
jgi:subtilisin family serine protease